jgi:hypothetical protein
MRTRLRHNSQKRTRPTRATPGPERRRDAGLAPMRRELVRVAVALERLLQHVAGQSPTAADASGGAGSEEWSAGLPVKVLADPGHLACEPRMRTVVKRLAAIGSAARRLGRQLYAVRLDGMDPAYRGSFATGPRILGGQVDGPLGETGARLRESGACPCIASTEGSRPAHGDRRRRATPMEVSG